MVFVGQVMVALRMAIGKVEVTMSREAPKVLKGKRDFKASSGFVRAAVSVSHSGDAK